MYVVSLVYCNTALSETFLVQIMKFLIMQFCPASYYKLPHIHIFSWQPGLKPLNLCSYLSMRI